MCPMWPKRALCQHDTQHRFWTTDNAEELSHDYLLWRSGLILFKSRHETASGLDSHFPLHAYREWRGGHVYDARS